MSNSNNLESLKNGIMPEAIQNLSKQILNSEAYMEMEKIRRSISPALGQFSKALQSYQNTYASMAASMAAAIQNVKAFNFSLLDDMKRLETLYSNALASMSQNAATLKLISDLDAPSIQSIVNSLEENNDELTDISIDTASALYDEGKITDEDIAEEVCEMVSKKDFSLSDTGGIIKKSLRFLAINFLNLLLVLLFSPVAEKVKNDALEAWKINEFWEESGVLEQIDKFFGIKNGAVSEQEAKDTVSEENVGNISKKKREDLLQKIQAIRDYISAAPQDENTGNLLAYLSELEKDVNGKKYGLVFEEHREEIDEVLDTHTPVLTEEKELFIDNGGQMNFLIEGDNLAALKLLEKTHRGKIDLIYIDPPYNTGKKDFRYDDAFVEQEDSFRHSKWVSFIYKRFLYAKRKMNRPPKVRPKI